MAQKKFQPINAVYLTEELGFEEDAWDDGNKLIPCFSKLYLDTVAFIALPPQHTPRSKLYDVHLRVFAFMSVEDLASNRGVCFENMYKLIDATAILDAECAPL